MSESYFLDGFAEHKTIFIAQNIKRTKNKIWEIKGYIIKVIKDNVNLIIGIKEDGMAVHGHIIREIATLFSTAYFVHENRRSNVDAHTISRSVIYAEFGRLVWMLSPPHGVCSYSS